MFMAMLSTGKRKKLKTYNTGTKHDDYTRFNHLSDHFIPDCSWPAISGHFPDMRDPSVSAKCFTIHIISKEVRRTKDKFLLSI